MFISYWRCFKDGALNIVQQVNLYQAQFKPKQVILPAHQMLLIALIPIIILVIFSSYFSYKQQLSLSLLQTQQHQQQLSQKQLFTLQQQLDARKENPLLVAELNDIQQQLTIKQNLVARLSNQSFGNQQGFSTMLTALSKQHIDKLWLTQFSLLDSGQFIALQGSAFSSQLIPEYIDNLAKSEQFHGKNFSVFQLEQSSDSPYFHFKLHTSKDVMGNKP